MPLELSIFTNRYMRILLIDDNEKLCLLYQQLIGRGGHEIAFETDARKALDRIRRIDPELLLLDIMMEPVSGWEVLEQVRADKEYSDLPIIILTGKVLTAPEALKYGMMIEGFIMKPLERNMLLRAVEEVKEVIDESNEGYGRALSSGMNPEDASACRNVIRKKKILQYLRENLTRQEQLLKMDADGNSEILESLDELRTMIATQFQQVHDLSSKCP